MPYIGTQPKDVRSFGRAKFDFTATQGQTAFTGADDDSKTLGFTDGQIEVYVNGILMDDSDFTTSNGNTVTLASAANLNDIISIVALQTDIPNSDYVPASGGTFSGNVAMSGTLGVTGAVTAANGLTVDDDGATPLTVDRATSDGTIIDVQKDGTSIGNIGTSGGDLLMYTTGASHGGLRFGEGYIFPVNNSGATSDGGFDLGLSVGRFKDLYLSSGIYVGGTVAANHLDDYEEGTWTPVIKGSSGDPSPSYTSQIGTYRKVGKLLSLNFYLHASSSSGGAGYIEIGGLPFGITGSATGGYPAINGGYYHMGTGGTIGTAPNNTVRWQANASPVTKLAWYGAGGNSWGTGAYEISGAGTLPVL